MPWGTYVTYVYICDIYVCKYTLGRTVPNISRYFKIHTCHICIHMSHMYHLCIHMSHMYIHICTDTLTRTVQNVGINLYISSCIYLWYMHRYMFIHRPSEWIHVNISEARAAQHTHTHTHTHANMYIYISTYLDVTHESKETASTQHIHASTAHDKGWQRPIGCIKLQVISHKRATDSRALLR